MCTDPSTNTVFIDWSSGYADYIKLGSQNPHLNIIGINNKGVLILCHIKKASPDRKTVRSISGINLTGNLILEPAF